MNANAQAVAADAAQGLFAAAFSADITPPIGEPLCYGLVPPAQSIEHRLAAKGVVLRQGGQTVVLCALDSGGLANDADLLFRKQLARAARTTASRVAVQSIHQHTVPAFDLNAMRLAAAAPNPPLMGTLAYFEAMTSAAAAAVKEATSRLRPISQIGRGWAPVNQVAAARRVRLPDGTIITRYSSTKNPDERNAPEGVIDGYLRSVAFLDGDQAVARLHYYATHPQSFYGDGRVTYDVPGIARTRREEETGAPHIYFNGCGGNLTMGKYNDGTPEARTSLAERLYDGMTRAAAAEQREPAGAMRWKVLRVRFPYHSGEEYAEERLRAVLADPEKPPHDRVKAAMVLAYAERVQSRRPFELTCLALGPVRIVNLPGESFIEYQLHAQSVAPDAFVAVAGYGDCPMGYICLDQAFSDRGGYEQTWSFTGPCERLYRGAIKRLVTTA